MDGFSFSNRSEIEGDNIFSPIVMNDSFLIMPWLIFDI